MKKVYLDYAATTPVDPRVLDAMLPYFIEEFGNPGSLHQFGQRASAAVFEARQTIAKSIGAEYPEIIFTGSATEANNLALQGAVKAYGSAFARTAKKARVIISAIEHESVLHTARALARYGVEVIIVPVSKEGIVDIAKLKAALTDTTIIVSVMYANNETGTVQPIKEIADIVQAFRGSHAYPLFHTDAAQAFNYLQCGISELGVDLMTISSQKIYGPKGAGALYVKSRMFGVTRQFPIEPIIYGGAQEQGVRSGTENVPAIVGFGKAVELAVAMREKESKRIAELRDYAWKGIKKIFPKAVLNGPSLNIPTFSRMSECLRLPNNLNFYIPKVSGEQMLVGLDLQGIAISSGSACTARSIDPSHVLLAMGYDKVRAKNSLRITLGRMTTKQEIDIFLKTLPSVIPEYSSGIHL